MRVIEKVKESPHLAAITVEEGIVERSVMLPCLANTAVKLSSWTGLLSYHICPASSHQEQWPLHYFQLQNPSVELFIVKLYARTMQGSKFLEIQLLALEILVVGSTQHPKTFLNPYLTSKDKNIIFLHNLLQLSFTQLKILKKKKNR